MLGILQVLGARHTHVQTYCLLIISTEIHPSKLRLQKPLRIRKLRVDTDANWLDRAASIPVRMWSPRSSYAALSLRSRRKGDSFPCRRSLLAPKPPTKKAFAAH